MDKILLALIFLVWIAIMVYTNYFIEDENSSNSNVEENEPDWTTSGGDF